jgi:thymidylate synthase
MTHPEYQYLKLMAAIIKDGKGKSTRGIHRIKSIFGTQVRFDMRAGFPLLTTKKMPFKLLLHELLWFISGSSDVTYLHEHNIRYWDGFLREGSNDLGRIYGVQWRHWLRPGGSEFDQLSWAIEQLKTNPDSKGIIVSAWNAGELGDKRWNPNDYGDMRLPPCHTMFQFDATKGKLRLHLYQRSWDVFLGAPFNIAQYAMLLHGLKGMQIIQKDGVEAQSTVEHLHFHCIPFDGPDLSVWSYRKLKSTPLGNVEKYKKASEKITKLSKRFEKKYKDE